MRAVKLTDEDLTYYMLPKRKFLYWKIKKAYLIVAMLEKWDAQTITLRTEENQIIQEKRDDVEIWEED